MLTRILFIYLFILIRILASTCFFISYHECYEVAWFKQKFHEKCSILENIFDLDIEIVEEWNGFLLEKLVTHDADKLGDFLVECVFGGSKPEISDFFDGLYISHDLSFFGSYFLEWESENFFTVFWMVFHEGEDGSLVDSENIFGVDDFSFFFGGCSFGCGGSLKGWGDDRFLIRLVVFGW